MNWTTTLFKSQGFLLEDSLTITLFMQLGILVGLFASSYLLGTSADGSHHRCQPFFMGLGLGHLLYDAVEFCFVGFLIMGCIQVWFYTYLAYTSESFLTKIRNTGLAVRCRPDAGLRHRFPARHSRFVRGPGFRESSTHSCCASSRPCSSPSPSVRQAAGVKSENGRKHPQRCVRASARNRQGLDMEAGAITESRARR